MDLAAAEGVISGLGRRRAPGQVLQGFCVLAGPSAPVPVAAYPRVLGV